MPAVLEGMGPMLTISGEARGKFCDGLTRRDFLKVGGLALGGLSLPEILQAEAQAGVRSSHKAIIMVFLAGGPPHQDMFDLKMDAPSGIRGEFQPIATNVPGIDICEHMPRLAAIMDKLVVIRTIVGAGGDHSAGQCLTGYTYRVSKVQGGRPSLGAILTKLKGPIDPAVPPFVGLSPITREPRWGNPGDSGYLGLPCAPFTPFRAEAFSMGELSVSHDRMDSRMSLLDQLDALRWHLDSSEAIEGMEDRKS